MQPTNTRIVNYFADAPEAAGLTPFENRVLADHKALGQIALIGVREGAVSPFVIQWRALVKGMVPCAQVLYCRSESDLVAYSQALGRYCGRHGRFLLALSANGSVNGLVGKYFAGQKSRYFSGPNTPQIADLAYTELVMFGP